MYKSIAEILEAAKAKAGHKRIAVAVAEDTEVLAALKDAYEMGLATAVLVGNESKIRAAAGEIGMCLEGFEIIDESDAKEAARRAVSLVSKGEAQMLMKGLVGTADLMRAVLDREIGLRTGRILSHVAVIEPKGYGRVLLMTDGGINIAPTLEQKAQMITNAVQVAKALGNECPKVVPVTALELVNENMPATVDAKELTEMNKRGEIVDCIVDGPLALDNAVSKEAAEHKGIKSPVAGEADIILVPFIEVGNVFYKALVYLAGADVAGVVSGARAPIILTSRADSHQAKLNSIATAVLMAN